ncbi:hypothetical protein KIW84_060607 [Lathyrus oleraceus]|uniref:Uncharacterized protein n=1 Tax=Pisum sativum TaxID=3888 RepID=A0A9D5A171_PEA|nr:hypothetical protein KIW84_060607 [Pisum sativum]
MDVMILELGGLYVVLGVSWLSTLSRMVMDWTALTMQFWHKERVVLLQGQWKLPRELEVTEVAYVYQNNVLDSRITMKEGKFPDFGLEDKFVSMEVGVDRNVVGRMVRDLLL